MSEPRNRKERRAAAKIKSAVDIPLKQPDRESREPKTLFQIAAERRPDLAGDIVSDRRSAVQPELIHTKINEDGSLSMDQEETDDEGPLDALGNAVLFGISFAMIHFTLDVLVHNQYAERVQWSYIASRAGLAVLAAFLVGSVAAGCYLVYVSSTFSYFAVMRQAPPLGVLWIYSVFEQRLEFAIVGLALVGGYFWWGGYSLLS